MRVITVLSLIVSLSVSAYGQRGNISGYVLDEYGKPLTNMTVHFSRMAVGQRFEAKTDHNGNYFRADLPGGEYLLSITIAGRSYKLDTHLGAQDIVATADGNIQTIYAIEAAFVNFDLRKLAASDPEERQEVSLAGLRIPRKAQDELKKAFDAKGDVETAKRHLEKAIEIAPNYAQALNNLGTIYFRGREYSQASACFERAANANPDSIVARRNLGATLLQLKEYERAATENIRVLASRPNDALAQGQAGIALLHLGRYDEAISHLERAKHLDPISTLHPGYVLASLYDDLGRDSTAIIEYAEFLKANPEAPGRSDVDYRIFELCQRPLSNADASGVCNDRPR